MKNIVVVWFVCVLLLVGLFAWLGLGLVERPENGNERGIIDVRFGLQSAKGPVTQTQFKGKYALYYFGYTHCPDVCPTTLLLIQNVLGELGEKGKKVTTVFITVDPERDTPKVVAQYAAHFGPNVVGLSGSKKEIDEVAQRFKVYHSKVEDKGSALGYTVDHSGFIYLVGPDGVYLTHFAPNVPEQALLKGLDQYVQ